MGIYKMIVLLNRAMLTKRKDDFMKLRQKVLVVTVCMLVLFSVSTLATALLPGEKKVGNTIVGRPISTPVKDLVNRVSLRSSSGSPNYYVVHETAHLLFEAYLQFQPCYMTSSVDEKYEMVPNRQVKNAVMDFQRQGRSVCDGPHRTRWGDSRYDCDIIYKRISAYDSITDWGESGTTYFWRRWFYFD